jgi:hypothetical protein
LLLRRTNQSGARGARAQPGLKNFKQFLIYFLIKSLFKGFTTGCPRQKPLRRLPAPNLNPALTALRRAGGALAGQGLTFRARRPPKMKKALDTLDVKPVVPCIRQRFSTLTAQETRVISTILSQCTVDETTLLKVIADETQVSKAMVVKIARPK